jgi:hypothetical protein
MGSFAHFQMQFRAANHADIELETSSEANSIIASITTILLATALLQVGEGQKG